MYRTFASALSLTHADPAIGRDGSIDERIRLIESTAPPRTGESDHRGSAAHDRSVQPLDRPVRQVLPGAHDQGLLRRPPGGDGGRVLVQGGPGLLQLPLRRRRGGPGGRRGPRRQRHLDHAQRGRPGRGAHAVPDPRRELVGPRLHDRDRARPGDGGVDRERLRLHAARHPRRGLAGGALPGAPDGHRRRGAVLHRLPHPGRRRRGARDGDRAQLPVERLRPVVEGRQADRQPRGGGRSCCTPSCCS